MENGRNGGGPEGANAPELGGNYLAQTCDLTFSSDLGMGRLWSLELALVHSFAVEPVHRNSSPDSDLAVPNSIQIRFVAHMTLIRLHLIPCNLDEKVMP